MYIYVQAYEYSYTDRILSFIVFIAQIHLALVASAVKSFHKSL